MNPGSQGDQQIDPILGVVAEVRLVHPYQATKAYTCPWCNAAIPAATGHYVVVPTEAPDLRRHWHRPCWENRHRRRAR